MKPCKLRTFNTKELKLQSTKSHSWKTTPRGKFVDWKGADRKLARDITTAVSHIKTLHGKPVRASLAAIIRAVGRQGWIQRYRNKLPLTAKAISEHAESLIDFSTRKVLWAEEHYRQEGFRPTRAQLVRHAVVFNKAGHTPAVQSVIDAAIERLMSSFRQ